MAFSKKYRFAPTLVLGALIAFFSLNNLQYYLSEVRLITSDQLFGIMFMPYQLLTGPLLLLYGIKLMRPTAKIKKRTFLLFLPFALIFALSLYYKIMYVSGSATKELSEICRLMLGVMEFFAIPFDQIIVLWLLWEIRKVKKHDAATFNLSKVRPELGWFKNILIVFFFLSFVWLYITFMTFVGGASQDLWYVIWIAISVMIYWLGHIGIYKFGVMEERKKMRTFTLDQTSLPVYERQRNEHVAAFEFLMIDQKRFLDSTLTLDKAADELKISKSHLSRMINSELKTGFPDYINALRVEEAKIYLLHPDFSNYTLVAIGLEAGFASKTTFNSTFKKVTGFTPSEFKNQSKIIPIRQLEKPVA